LNPIKPALIFPDRELMTPTVAPSPLWIRVLRGFGRTLLWFVLGLLTVWAVAALYVDVRTPALRAPLAVLYAIAALLAVIRFSWRFAAVLWAAGFGVVLMWWQTLQPSNDGPWNPNLDRTASIDVNGDDVVIHNLRNCDYRAETEYSNCWSDRTVHLSKLRGGDFFFTTWGPKYIAHPIVSFDFGDDGHVAFSIEVRYRPGQEYSALLGFFRQFALIFVVADERDVIRLRTNYREGENVFLYRTTVAADVARKMFLTYVQYLNNLRDHPEWYNALTRNCTTTMDQKVAADMPNPKGFSLQLVLNGTMDELLYERGRLVTGGLDFPALKQQAHINPSAKEADHSPDFSARIRLGRVGF
jgi:hypothetical protein